MPHHVEFLTELHGLPVHDFAPWDEDAPALPVADAVAWRVAYDPVTHPSDDRLAEHGFAETFARFLELVEPGRVRALVIGQWADYSDEDSAEVVELLVHARERLTALEAVFLGDIEPEQMEISWITHHDVTPVLTAYPGLRTFGVRGGGATMFPPVRHPELRSLVVESGGLPAEVVRGISASELPALERLELWLGDETYGGGTTAADLAPLLSGERFPALRHLGLKNSDSQDEIAAAVATAPVVPRLDSLSLGMGTLTDAGAEALLTGQPLTHLTELDLGFHYVSDALSQRLRDALEPHGVAVDLSDSGHEDNAGGRRYRFTAVAE